MKKRKLLILLAAILSFTLLLASCDKPVNKGDEPDTQDTETDKLSNILNGYEQKPVDHEIRDYFDLKSNIEVDDYSEYLRIDGEIVSYDGEHNLIAVKTLELDEYNNVVETVKVYDLNTNEVINTQTVKNSYGADDNELTVMSVDIDYPVIRVAKEERSEDSDTVYNVSYYFAKAGSEAIYETDSVDYEMNRLGNGLVSCKMGDKVYLIDKDMSVVRTVEAIVANGYDSTSIAYEYCGYLYSINEYGFQIFDRDGMCSVSYIIDNDQEIIFNVLDNGNVLLQLIEEVDEYTPCDFVLSEIRYTLTSYVVSYTDGAITEVELDYLVYVLDSAYDEGKYFGFDLAEGRDNHALIYRIANQKLAINKEYVVINNELEIEYTLKTTVDSIDYFALDPVNANYYTSWGQTGGTTNGYIFDLDGNVVTTILANMINTKYIVSNGTIYDYNMNVVYNFEEKGYTFVSCNEASDNVFLSKYNYETGCDEIWLFNSKTAAPTLLIDGVDTQLEGIGSCVYSTVTDGITSLYYADGTLLAVTYSAPTETMLNGMVIYSTEFEGKIINYILK